jgi:hypothetical protein
MPVPRRFRMAARASAAALIRPGEELHVRYKLDGKDIDLTFRTRYLDLGFSDKVPGDLWVDAEGEADGLLDAARNFGNAARDIAAVIALAANAAVSEVDPEVVFESTSGITTKRPYFQRYMAPDAFAMTSRFVDVPRTVALISAVEASEEKNRLIRAISQYSEALKSWRLGAELLAVSHLFMGVEALKRAAWRHLALVQSISDTTLGAQWGFDENGQMKLHNFLDAEARVRLIFSGDQECHRLAKYVSDHFEHGFSNAGNLHPKARNCVIPTARYLREAIFSLLSLDGDILQAFTSEYAEPRGAARLEQYFFGELIGNGEKLAAEGSEYPICAWRSSFEDVSFNSAIQKYQSKPRNELTLSCAPGVSLTPTRFEIWDGSRISFADPSTHDTSNNSPADHAKVQLDLTITRKSHDVPA